MHAFLRVLWILMVAGGVVLSRPVTAAAQYARPTANGVSIHAEQAPLGAVLRELAGIITVDRLTIDPAVENRLVTFAIEDVGVWTGVLRLLHAARVDYVLAIDAAGKSTRLGVVDLPKKDSVAAASAAPMAAAPGSAAVDADIDREKQVAREDATLDPDASGPDASEVAARTQQMIQVMSMPRVPAVPGTLIELPFPAADGGPRFATQPPSGTPAVLPVAPSPPEANTAGRQAPRPAVTDRPPAADPTVQQLFEALVPVPR